MTAILFSETGLEPIRYRRAKQLVNYLRYLVEPDGWNRLVADALADSLDLARTHHISWVNDICIVLSKLPIPIFWDLRLPDAVSVHTVDKISKTRDLFADRL
ncbi:hypothetical protein B0H10DRAFT_2135880, partial [Mycena sp. CBHHK59/15]